MGTHKRSGFAQSWRCCGCFVMLTTLVAIVAYSLSIEDTVTQSSADSVTGVRAEMQADIFTMAASTLVNQMLSSNWINAQGDVLDSQRTPSVSNEAGQLKKSADEFAVNVHIRPTTIQKNDDGRHTPSVSSGAAQLKKSADESAANANVRPTTIQENNGGRPTHSVSSGAAQLKKSNEGLAGNINIRGTTLSQKDGGTTLPTNLRYSSTSPPISGHPTADDKAKMCAIQETLPRKTKQRCKGGPFVGTRQSEGSNRHIAVIVRGESFRGLKGMYDRHIDVTPETFKCQQEASRSHVTHIIQPWERCGFTIDVFLSTWQAHGSRGTNSSKSLIEMYGNRVRNASFENHLEFEKVGLVRPGHTPQHLNYMQGLDMAASYSLRHKVAFDAMLIIRYDLIFKGPLNPQLKWQKMMFAFREWELAGDLVADTIHYFPYSFANCVYLDGFREHFSIGIVDRIGNENLHYLTNGRHDANSMADRNPIYKMCRPEQLYDIHGGFAILMFSVKMPTPNQVESVGFSVRDKMYLQAKPRALAPLAIVTHTWINDDKGKKAIKDLVKFRYGQVPASMSWDTLEGQGLLLQALISFCKVFDTMMDSNLMKDRMRILANRFAFDRLIFARADHVFRTPIDSYACNVKEQLCVGYGGKDLPSFPVVIITSQHVAQRMVKKMSLFNQKAKSAAAIFDSANQDKEVRQHLERAADLHLTVVCNPC